MSDTITDAVKYLVTNIVKNPDDVKIDETESDGEQRIISLQVHKDDMGLVIGKQGRIIRAIRDLVKLIAAKQGTYVDVVLDESQA